MNGAIPETIYRQVCFRCMDDLYHTAGLVLTDADEADQLVTEICVAGVHQYSDLEDEAEIRFRLFTELCRRLKRRLRFRKPKPKSLPEPFRALSGQERLLIAMRFSSGLPLADSGRILGLSADEYEKCVSRIVHRTMKP